MTVALITGIEGFTGGYLAARLRDVGHEVHGTVRHEDSAAGGNAENRHVCDLLDQERVTALIASLRPDYVIHLAAVAFVAHADFAAMYDNNILGTRALLEACAQVSRAPRAVLIASSANVYGNASAGMLAENSPIRPANDYSVSKVAVENLAAIYAERLPVIVSRPFNYTGRGQSETFLIPKIVSHIRNRATMIELGNLDVARDFSDVRALTDVYLRLLEAPEAIGETFNVCSGEAISLQEIIALACDIANFEIKVTVNPALVRANEVKVLRGSRLKLEGVIGPVDMPPFRETLRWMLEV